MQTQLSEYVVLTAFGSTLRDFPNQLGISQEELAFRSQLHRTYISDIERGKRNVALINIIKLSIALEVKPEELLAATTIKMQSRGFSTK